MTDLFSHSTTRQHLPETPVPITQPGRHEPAKKVVNGVVSLAAALVKRLPAYRSWQQHELTHIVQDGILCETRLGPVEYQLHGSGPAVIYAHGTPGGYEQGSAFAHFIDTDQCTFISPSRPGYLRTPLTAGATPEQQADLYVALLDALGIERASIIGFSGGGPSALQFAIRHPDRCRSLIMIGGITQRNVLDENYQALPLLKRFSARLEERLLCSDPFIFLALPIATRIRHGVAVAGMLCSGAAIHLRQAGYDNDWAQFATIGNYPLERITAPTLVVHGTHDQDVPFADAQLLMEQVSNVTLVTHARGDHAMFYTHAHTVMPMVRDFILHEQSAAELAVPHKKRIEA